MSVSKTLFVPPRRRKSGSPATLPRMSKKAMSNAATALGLEWTMGPMSRTRSSIASGSLPMIMSRMALAAAAFVAWVSPVIGGNGQASPRPVTPWSVRTRTRRSLAAVISPMAMRKGDVSGRSKRKISTSVILSFFAAARASSKALDGRP